MQVVKFLTNCYLWVNMVWQYGLSDTSSSTATEESGRRGSQKVAPFFLPEKGGSNNRFTREESNYPYPNPPAWGKAGRRSFPPLLRVPVLFFPALLLLSPAWPCPLKFQEKIFSHGEFLPKSSFSLLPRAVVLLARFWLNHLPYLDITTGRVRYNCGVWHWVTRYKSRSMKQPKRSMLWARTAKLRRQSGSSRRARLETGKRKRRQTKIWKFWAGEPGTSLTTINSF